MSRGRGRRERPGGGGSRSWRRRRTLLVAGCPLAAVLLIGTGVARWLLAGGAGAEATDVDHEGGRAEVPRVEDLATLDPAVAEAIRVAVAGVERAPGSGVAWGELGVIYHAHRYFALARRSYEAAARLDAATPDWPHLLGVLAEERGDVAEAAARYRAELERAPAHAAARYRLGNVLLQAGMLTEATRAFEQLEAVVPAEPWAEIGLGRAALRREETAEAARRFERALALDPDNAQAAHLLAAAYRLLGRQAEAGRLAERARDGIRPVGPADPILDRVRTGVRSLHAVVTTANQTLAAGNVTAAESLYSAVIAQDPDHYDALYNLGLLYGRQGRFAESESVLVRAVAARPRGSEARFLLTLALLSQERFDAARDQLRALLAVDPGHAEAERILDELSR